MIRLDKGPEPSELALHKNQWTQVIADHHSAGTNPTKADKSRYNHPTIKSALLNETRGKCAYCESKFGHVTYGDVEHIVAKKNGVHLMFEWVNLTISCDVCNTNKGDKDDIVDPYICDPAELFICSGPMILPRPGHDLAMLTEYAMKLNRPSLIERRADRIKQLHDIVLLAVNHPNASVKRAIIEDLKASETSGDREFAAVSRAYIGELQTSGVI
jgi:hypothetical protein